MSTESDLPVVQVGYPMFAPDQIGARVSGHDTYPVTMFVDDHNLSHSVVLKLTGTVGRELYHQLRLALVKSGEFE